MSISLVRGQAESVRPPRALHCEFPLGRPLGRPTDVAFQRQVLAAAFALLEHPDGPVLVDYPERIEDSSAAPLACTLPPREGTGELPAVDEAAALRPAYDRSQSRFGRTLVGRTADADGIPPLLAAFAAIAEGRPWREAGLPGHPLEAARDVIAYYEEAAAAMMDHVPAARSAESWFLEQTASGELLERVRMALRRAGEPFWFHFMPFRAGGPLPDDGDDGGNGDDGAAG